MVKGRSARELLAEADSQPVQGWDFSWLGERMSPSSLPWDFSGIVAERAREAADMLDLGTGGGEWLAALPRRARRTVATESWPPNVDLAGERLRPLGVTVVAVTAAPDNVDQRSAVPAVRLPFPAASFDLVVNRHESFVATEVARVLAPGGRFLTQQVGGGFHDEYDALGLLPPDEPVPWDLKHARRQVESAGLRVGDSGQAVQTTSFADVGAFAWYLKAIPWIVGGFSIESNREELERLHEQRESRGSIHVRQLAFWFDAAATEPEDRTPYGRPADTPR